jgi:hypothetical protein
MADETGVEPRNQQRGGCLEDNVDTRGLKQPFFNTVIAWLGGARSNDIAPVSGLDLDELLGLHGRVVSYVGNALRTAGDDRGTLMAAARQGLRENAASWALP